MQRNGGKKRKKCVFCLLVRRHIDFLNPDAGICFTERVFLFCFLELALHQYDGWRAFFFFFLQLVHWFARLWSLKQSHRKKQSVFLYSSKPNVDQPGTNSKKKYSFVCTCCSLGPSPKTKCVLTPTDTVILISNVPQWLRSKNTGFTCT